MTNFNPYTGLNSEPNTNTEWDGDLDKLQTAEDLCSPVDSDGIDSHKDTTSSPKARGTAALPSRAQVIRALNQRIPQRWIEEHQQELPEGYHRADLLAPEQVVKGILRSAYTTAESPLLEQGLGEGETYTLPLIVFNEQLVQHAYQPLSYDEGYPTQPDGRPFWQQLEFEPLDAHAAFQAYLTQGSSGARQLFLMHQSVSIQQAIQNARLRMGRKMPPGHSQHHSPSSQHPSQSSSPDAHGSDQTTRFASRPFEDPRSREFAMPGVSNGTNTNGTNPNSEGREVVVIPLGAQRWEFTEWFYLYSWGDRARAYDLFYVASIRRNREVMALQQDNTHLTFATKMFAKLEEVIDGKRPEWQDADGNGLFWQALAQSPRTAIEFGKMLVQMQRLSLGHAPNMPTPHRMLEKPGTLSNQTQSSSSRAVAGPKASGGGSDLLRAADVGGAARSAMSRALPSPDAHSRVGGRPVHSPGVDELPGASLPGRLQSGSEPLAASQRPPVTVEDPRAKRIRELLNIAAARRAG